MISAIKDKYIVLLEQLRGTFYFVRQFRKVFPKEVILQLTSQEQAGVNQLKRDGKTCYNEKF